MILVDIKQESSVGGDFDTLNVLVSIDLGEIDYLLSIGLGVDIYPADLLFRVPAHEPRLLHDLLSPHLAIQERRRDLEYDFAVKGLSHDPRGRIYINMQLKVWREQAEHLVNISVAETRGQVRHLSEESNTCSLFTTRFIHTVDCGFFPVNLEQLDLCGVSRDEYILIILSLAMERKQELAQHFHLAVVVESYDREFVKCFVHRKERRLLKGHVSGTKVSDPRFVEISIKKLRGIIIFLLLLKDKCVGGQSFLLEANLTVANLTLAPEYHMAGEVLAIELLRAQLVACFYAPGLLYVVDSKSNKLVAPSRKVKVLISRLHVLESERVPMQQWSDM